MTPDTDGKETNGDEVGVGAFLIELRPLKNWPNKPAIPNNKARRLARLLKHAYKVEGFACMSAVERKEGKGDPAIT